jgi:signal transduction histidine kinase
LRGRPWSWITGRPRLTDGLVVAFSLLAGGPPLIFSGFQHSIAFALIPLVLVQSASLWWRRAHAVVVLAVVVVCGLLMWALLPNRDPSGPALVFAVYAASVYGPSRARLWVAGVAIAVIAIAVVFLAVGQLNVSRSLLPAAATSLVAWVIGDYIRSRRRFLVDLVDRHRQEREQAAGEERLRIARELHDVVAHNVSVIAINAGAARVSGSGSAEALRSIEESARATLAELNRLVGVLRKGPEGPELAPQPTLDDIESVLKPARDAGLDVAVKVSGAKRELPAALDLSAFRIVQESVTNVLKHANASRVEVVIDYEDEGIALTISDNGSGPDERLSTGHGLIGMRERVALFGGKMGTGSSPLGGFTVHARLPYKN